MTEPKKKILVITTVGESLRTKWRETLLQRTLEGTKDGLDKEKTGRLKDAVFQPPDDDELKTRLGSFTPDVDPKTAPCAELASLMLLQKELERRFDNNYICEHILVPTEETEDIASLLKCWLAANKDAMQADDDNILVHAAGELDVEEKDKFHAGLAQVAGIVIKKLREAVDKYAARYLNLTGGYKGIIPVLSLLGYTKSVNICYAHEKSGDILLMPELPVAWDRQRLDEVRGFVLRSKISGDEYNLLPHEYKFLFQKPHGASRYERTALGELVARAETASTRFGYGRYLLDMLGQDDRKILEDKLKEWEHLWLGDQIPETVEHSRLHALRLLGFAYQLFLAFPNLKEQVGGPHGLYLLICAIWLHDIGHVAMEFKHNGKMLPIGLMPSLVREWHHYSSAAMIGAGERYIANVNDRKVVTLLAEYHRGDMRLDGDPAEFDEPYGHGILTAKRKTLRQKLNGETLPNGITVDHVLRLAALLRFIDGCDVQTDRTGGEKYIEARKKRTHDEVSFLQTRLATLSITYPECHYLAFCDAVANDNHLKLLHVSLNDQIEFKKTQFEHFKEHQSIALAFLYKGTDNKLRVGLEPTELAKDNNEYAELLKKRAAGIADEYTRVKSTLRSILGFSGVYVIEGDNEIPAQDWKNDKGGSS